MRKTVMVVAGVFMVISAVAAQQPSPQMQMALENMQRVMMDMPLDQRMAYMMQKQQDAIEHGRQLYNDAGLSANNRSCNTCHPGGGSNDGEAQIPMPLPNGAQPSLPVPSLIGAAATFPKYKVPNDAVITLPVMNNNCIAMFMGGAPLDLNGQDSKDLAAYVTSLSEGREVSVTGQ